MLTTIDLAALVAGQGTTIFGADADDQSGFSVSDAGDVNGDGFDDLLIGARLAGAAGNTKGSAGESYVIFGGASLPPAIDLANLGTAGITIFGAGANDYSGFSVSTVGDVNGDGFDDLLIGAWGADALGNTKSSAGDSYLIFGRAALPTTIDLANLSTAGITIFGVDANDDSGISVSGAGDVNGDGFDDLLIGARGADASGNTKSNAGESYVIFGGASLPTTINLASLGTAGVTIFGADASDYSGFSVSTAGDVNGDGFDDLLIGAFGADASGNTKSFAGDSYVIFGNASLPTTIDLAGLGTAGVTISGANVGDWSGRSVSSAGDVNGDGFDDLLIGAYGARGSGAAAGNSYVIFGSALLPTTIDLATLGTAGITVDIFDGSGGSVSSAGDVNGDGFDDLLIGAHGASALGNTKPSAGESYVIFGGTSLPTTINLASLGTAGVIVFGADAGDISGRSVSSAGDVNGDGFDDLVIGANQADASGNTKSFAGDSYIIFGRNSFTNSILPANLGTSAANTITGTTAAQIINGADGNDVLIGNGGADILLGGRGNDILAISDLNFRRIVGGNGTDTLRLDGSGLLLNLSSVRDNRLLGIEVIDLTGSGNNTLTLSAREVLNLSDSSNTLTVRGNAGDRVLTLAGWTEGNNETIGPDTFRVFTQGAATLKLLLGVTLQTTSIDLANLGFAGTTIFGADVGDLSGISVSSAGDVNGDGFDDLLIGATGADAAGNTKSDAGDSYVIFGGTSLPPTIDLANLGTAGITIFGADAEDRGGRMSSAGDVNGDGFDDLLIGANSADASGNAKFAAGESYVIFGSALLPTTIDLANLGTAGITIFGADAFDNSGLSVSGAGDVNGDGFDDLIIGAHVADASGNTKYGAGDSYVIFGGVSLPTTIDLANLGTADITIFGADTNDRSGVSVSSAGDVNGDGFDDLLIGASSGDASGNAKYVAGDTYIIFGGASLPPTIDLANLGTAGITIFGAGANDYSGSSVSTAGDVNGDGFDDLLIGAFSADASENTKLNAGESYVIFGSASLPPTIDLASLGTFGITFYGAEFGDRSGASVSSAGDINGDGFDDLLIGATFAAASGNTKHDAGDSYVIFGGASLPLTIDLANLGTAGIAIFGADAHDRSGVSVSNAGDVNGDGFGDLLIGAFGADALANSKYGAGESYIIFGGNSFTNSILPANLGTSAANTITGTTAAQIINGADGNDVLIGNGGADILLGGRGNDILAISDLNFRRIVGGNGIDALRLDGSGLAFDLSLVRDNRLLGIEVIDLTGSGNNTLTLNRREVLNLSDESNTLLVQGNSGDQVRLDGGWTRGADEVINTVTYRVLTQGAATLKVAAAISLLTPTTIDLSNLGTAGTTIFGADAGDQSGLLVSNAGDINGDGFDDLLISARLAGAAGNTKSLSGDSYVIFGGASLPPTIDLANLGTGGITIFGASASDYSGFSVSTAGDVNGDGFDDLLIGAWGADALGDAKADAGDSYVIFGGVSLPPTIDLAALGAAGVTIYGAEAGDRSGVSVSSAGDVNGDGFDDLLIGANLADALGNAKSGAGDSYLIFGAASLPATIDLANLGSAGIRIFGAEAEDYSGRSVSSAGDLNGDGFGDLLIGAYRADASGNTKSEAGDSYVIFGGASLPPTIDLAMLGVTGVTGITIFGADSGDRSGLSVSSAGDVNGDGFDDLLIGAFRADASGNAKLNAGDGYVIFGSASLPTTIDLASLGTAGITIFGADADDRTGISVSSAGDVNGDGFDDLLIGAFLADASGNTKSSSGESYMLFGGASLPTTINLASLGTAGITIFGVDVDDRSGRSVSSAGDVNGDGFEDLIIGAYFADASANTKSEAGESYVIFGGDFTAAVTHAGTAASETLTGTASANVMIGGRGNDTLLGGGGADVLTGGHGNDVLAISDLTFQRIVGGTGIDTLRLDGSSLSLDLSSVRDNRLLGIEVIDLTGSGNNTLTLSAREVLNLSDSSNTLTVRGNAGDRVSIGGWAERANETILLETFRVFTQSAATLKVLQGVSIQITSIDLANFGFAGTTIFGADAGDLSGISVNSAGDVNGDGFDDLLIGSYRADASGNTKTDAGDSYLIFGGASLPTTIDLANLGAAGITIFGADANDRSGLSLSSAGDVNGDGFDDLLIGSRQADASGNAKSDAGESYVIFGGASLPPTIDLASLGTAGITIFGADSLDRSGRAVSSAGDVNGDGFDDLLIGAYRADASGNTKPSAGDIYVIFGGATLPTTIDLASLGATGITIFGADADDLSGVSVSAAGDVNGDGFDDLLIGAYRADASGNTKSDAGGGYVIFGSATLPPTIDLANLGTAGITIFGADISDYSGFSLSGAGDVNGDGFDDLLIGAPIADASGNTKLNSGESYVIFGSALPPTTINLASLGTAGITIFGADADDRTGVSVSSAGDVNGDGFDDLLIGAFLADASGNTKSSAGDSYMLFGRASLPTTINLASLGTVGITIFGVDVEDRSGRSVSNAGDVNGDGFNDLLIGAYLANASGNAKSDAGESYVIFGGDFTAAVTHAGTAASETLTGTVSANAMIGGRGNDTLVGGGGADVLTGGHGNDVLAISDLTFQRIVGGTGTDTLRLDGSGLSLDLISVRDNRLLGIEVIDLTGSGNNTLTLSAREVLNLSDSSNTLTVRGNAGDRISTLAGWAEGANETILSDTFRVFTQGAATLKVLQGVSIQITSIDLANFGFAGTTIFGADFGDVSGSSVSSGGDVNGDGFDDLLIGASFADASGNTKPGAGDSYIIFGGASLPPTIDLASLGTAGITIFGADSSDFSGRAVSGAGDVNGDGFDDLLIGAYLADASGNTKSSAGESYVIFGIALLPPTIDLASLGTAGVTIFGTDSGDFSGFSVSSAGDVNGDGYDDFVIGAFLGDASGNARLDAGESYVIFGGASLPPTIDLASLDTAGVTIFGADSGDLSGRTVSSAGDVNGDGFDDVLIGAYRADASGNIKSDAGDSYLLFGGASLPPTIDLASLGTAGVTIFGADSGDFSGRSVSSAGDVNGDGFDDLLIGARGADASGNGKSNAGDSYVIFGGASLPPTIDLATLGTSGFTIFGADAFDGSGHAVSSAGDVNGDGFDDLLIGAYNADASNNTKPFAGNSYVIFGGNSLPGTVDLATLGNNGVTIFGAGVDDRSGFSVSSAGDVNGDGFDDLLIGARYADASGNGKSDAGDSYVIFGGNSFTNSVLPANLGTNAADTITGTAAAEIISGSDGDDTLVGGGGADVLLGGRGNDILAISDLNFRRIVGGNGTDTLRLDGSGLLLNLTAIRDNRISGIEVIDLTGSGNNTLALNQREVLNLSDESNALVVRRNKGDLVNLQDIIAWTQSANEMVGSDTFEVYTHGAATLKIQTVNEAPTQIALSQQSIAENNTPNAVIGVFTTTDPNENDTFTYSFVSGPGSIDNVSFTIAGNQLRPSISFDHETKSSYSIRVRTTDQDGLFTEQQFSIQVVDVNEAPTALVLTPNSASLPEDTNTVSAIPVASIMVVDDALGVNALSLSGNDATSFDIVGMQLLLRAGVTLDFESKSTYTVIVNVNDLSIGSAMGANSTFTLTLTDIVEDVTAPTSSIQTLLANANSLSIPLTVTGADVPGPSGDTASGVKEYDLFVAINSGAFSYFATVPATSPTTTFSAVSNRTYFFRSIARDFAGNLEVKPDNYADVFTRTADLDKPSTQVVSATPDSSGLFLLTASGSDTGGSQLSSFEFFVSIDDAPPVSIGSAGAGLATAGINQASTTYQGIADGNSRSYRFFTQGRDSANNVEDAPSTGDITTVRSFAASPSLQATGIDVQRGARQRSAINTVDVSFNSSQGLTNLLLDGRIIVERFELSATNVTAGTGAAVPIQSLQVIGSKIRIQFNGMLTSDGLYRVRVDANGDGNFIGSNEAFEFHRLRGDANGDGIVNSLDTAIVDSLFGRIGSDLDGDLNGDGIVNTTDKSMTLRTNIGRRLADPLRALLDD